MTTIGVLALQGDFVEHQAMLRRLGVEARQVRTPPQLEGLDGLIIPGGESTTFCRLMEDFGLYAPLKSLVGRGVPTWGTCAGLIVMARQASDLDFPTLNVLDVAVERNGFGRQTDSFESDLSVPALGDGRPYHAVFIRAPVVDNVGEDVDVLARLPEDGRAGAGSAVALRQGPHLATTFHPELTDDDRFHRYFLKIARREARGSSAK